ncbi:MAG: pyridoxal-phosphate dependent enzyme [Candidatus Tectomicrobia bacterium]|nr:pyridoxal-phosphate dependent enzyme [Candidatus Tectomicrobia bacterium]
MDSPRTTDEVKPLDAGWVAEEAARAAGVISRYLRPTPCRFTEHFSEQLGLEVYLKPENFQRTGSFQVRGAFSAASRPPPSQRRRHARVHPQHQARRGEGAGGRGGALRRYLRRGLRPRPGVRGLARPGDGPPFRPSRRHRGPGHVGD